ncbi:beta-galactosidase [Nonomuraea sp. NPDC050153]|uniref:beta-galactosidase n=1 Tax=Nonomuraea sp. NPDC050153 TaxID=3364359 RepID=UPI003799CB1B
MRHTPWDRPETRPAMADAEDPRPGLALTSRSLWRDGRRWIRVTGELHYSRVSRERWQDSLRLVKAGGVNVVSTYVFWIHHQEHEDREPVFDGGLDVAAFGDRLAGMNATIPPQTPLRWSLRSDGRAGFVFVSNHQPYEPLPARRDVVFDLELDGAQVRFPHRPVDVPSGAFFCWPVNLEVCGVTINWATLGLLTVVEGPVLVLTKTDGVPAHLSLPAGTSVSGHPVLERDGEVILEDLPGGRVPVTVETPDGSRLRLLVLDAADALRAWTPGGRLVLSDADIVEADGALTAVTTGPATVEIFKDGAFERHDLDHPRAGAPARRRYPGVAARGRAGIGRAHPVRHGDRPPGARA